MHGRTWLRLAGILVALAAVAVQGAPPAVRVAVAQPGTRAVYSLPEDYGPSQGGDGWSYYEAAAPGSYRELSFDTSVSPWGTVPRRSWNSDTTRFLEITGPPEAWILPGEGMDAAIGWQAPRAGEVSISASMTAVSTSTEYGAWCGVECDDGITFSIYQGDQLLAGPVRVLHGSPEWQTNGLEATASVQAGDQIVFYVGRGEWQDNDQTRYALTITYPSGDGGTGGPTPTPCVPGPMVDCGSRGDDEGFEGYTVGVATAAEQGAGAPAAVSIRLTGTGGEVSGTLDLSDASLSPGSTATFTPSDVSPTLTDVGEVSSIRLTYEGGASPAWYCTTVTVTRTVDGVGTTWTYPVYSWLPTKPGNSRSASAAADENAMGYHVEVATGDEPNAGTDADVVVDVRGVYGENTGALPLDTPNVDDHERNTTTGFYLRGWDVGEVGSVVLSHDGSGQYPGWFPSTVTVRRIGGGATCIAPVYTWIPTTTGDGSFEAYCGSDETGYAVAVRTGGMAGAGTDGDVWVDIIGGDRSTGNLFLDDPDVDDFEVGDTNTFYVRGTHVGEATRIWLTRTGGGDTGSWYCDWVTVRDIASGETWTFDVYSWIPGGDATVDWQVTVPYQVRIVTANEPGAGTDADVSIALVGDGSITHAYLLDSPADDFEANSTGTYQIRGPRLSAIDAVVLSHDNSDDDAAWYPATVTVTDPAGGQVLCSAPVYDWIPDAYGTLSVQYDCGAPWVGYFIQIATEDVDGAGTDADVDVTLIGVVDTWGPQRLDTPYVDDFERDTVSSFYIRGLEVGDLLRIGLGHSNTGTRPGWLPGSIIIRNVATRAEWSVYVGSWLEAPAGQQPYFEGAVQDQP